LSDGHNKDRRFLRSSESGDTSEYVAGIRREVRLYPCPRSSCSSKPGSFDPQSVQISLLGGGMMLSFFKRGVFVLAATILCIFALGAAPAVSDVGLQNVTLSCSDGTNLDLALSPAEVLSLTNAVTAMSLYPAELTCGVTTQQADPPTAGSKKFDSAVGGGDQFVFLRPCSINFGFSAHTPDGIPLGAKGSFNETVPGGCAGLGFTGQLRVSIVCLDVKINHADMHGIVTKATGAFAEDGFIEGGDAFISTTDNGKLDTLGVDTVPSGPSLACGGTIKEPQILNGDINVHDA
jgi:hypothetical protein